MKLLVSALLVTLAMTTGFTCSKNEPTEVSKTETAPPPVQDQMGAPAPTDAAAAPASGEATPSNEPTAPAAPATEPAPGH